MAYHSQNNEAEVIIKYFGDFKGNLLDLGANDGITLSNSYDLIQLGWTGLLVEPSKSAYLKLMETHIDNLRVFGVNIGISTTSGTCTFYEAADTLLSTIKKEQTEVWKDHDFKENKANFLTFEDAKKNLSKFNKKFDFISIDCEGMDLDILRQMNLKEMGCRCICIEHGNNRETYNLMVGYCGAHGLTKELLYNGENTILAL